MAWEFQQRFSGDLGAARRAALPVAVAACEHVGVIVPSVTGDPSVDAAAAMAFAKNMDEEALVLLERLDDIEPGALDDPYDAAFRRARAAMSYAYALKPDDWFDLRTAIYEAGHSFDDPEEFESVVRTAMAPT